MLRKDRCADCDGFLWGYCSHCKTGGNMAEIKDSGSRREFESGAVRDNGDQEQKGRFDLIPWEVIWDLAKHFAKGSAKYGDHNWQKGIPVSSYFDSCERHLVKHWLGHDDEDHLLAALWNITAWMWEERYSPRANSVMEDTNGGVNQVNEAIKKVALKEPAEAFRKALDRAFTSSPDLTCEMCGKTMSKGYATQRDGKIKKICPECYRKLR